jgi:very-short-patch-repair endonuclease
MALRSQLSTLRQQNASLNAKALRRTMTDAERKLWLFLRNRRLDGYKFRRQVPVGPYVADFLCERARLIVEVDGGQHADATVRDNQRSAWLSQHGYRVQRFWNNEVLQNLDGVWERIASVLAVKP